MRKSSAAAVRFWLRFQSAMVLVLGCGSAFALEQDAHPLEPVDLSSPRAVLVGFMDEIEVAWVEISQRRLQGRPTAADAAYIGFLADRIIRRLDLSDVAPTARVEEGYDAATYLYEVLSRLELPPTSDIPDASAFPPAGPAEWRVPHTEITIVRSTEAGQTDEFRFSRDTVARAQTYFKLVEHLPYRRDVPIENVSRLRQVIPGWMIPNEFVYALPAPLVEIVFGQAVWKLIAFALMVLLIGFIVWIAARLARTRETASPVRHYVGRLVAPAVLLSLLPLAVYATTEQINLVGDFAQGVKFTADIVGILAGTWVAWLACLALAELFISAPKEGASSLNAQLLRLTGRVAGIVLGLTVIFIGANRIGLPLLGVLAGVGVGGLAIALAAQDSLKNLLGSLMIFMDQPYKPGQRVIVEGVDGFVEQIGLRSTRIRGMNGSLATIPNEKMARLDIENIGERTFMRRVANIRLPIDTPREKIERALAILTEILKDHKGMQPELPPRVYFSEFNPDSFNIYVSYWYHPPKRWQFFAFNEQVNLAILKRFNEEGIEFALPASAMRVTTDTGSPSPSGSDLANPLKR